MKKFLKPAVADYFYPGDKEELEDFLSSLLSHIPGNLKASADLKIAALISPHAGYVFSAAQAAKAFARIQGSSYNCVCIVSPSHREYFNFLSIFSGDGLSTPLGDLPVNEKARKIAASCPGVQLSSAGYHGEHALEVQLPFLQMTLNDFSILPVVMGDQDSETVDNLAEMIRCLKNEFKEKILFVISSDLSHFHPDEKARRIDGRFIGLLQQHDEVKMQKELADGSVEACGGGLIRALLKAFSANEYDVETLGYCNSGDVLNNKNEVVGYTSAVMTKKRKDHD